MDLQSVMYGFRQWPISILGSKEFWILSPKVEFPDPNRNSSDGNDHVCCFLDLTEPRRMRGWPERLKKRSIVVWWPKVCSDNRCRDIHHLPLLGNVTQVCGKKTTNLFLSAFRWWQSSPVLNPGTKKVLFSHLLFFLLLCFQCVFCLSTYSMRSCSIAACFSWLLCLWFFGFFFFCYSVASH